MELEALKIPDIFQFNRFLIFEPHPDDLELFIGGTVLKLRKQNKEVIIVEVTNGSKGTALHGITEKELEQTRIQERKEGAKLMDIKDIIFLNHEDGNVPDKKVLSNEFLRIIREIKPDCIFAPDPFLPYEFHDDHITTGYAAGQAFFFSPMPLFLEEVPTHTASAIAFYATAYPNTYIDISEVFEKKLELISIHKSQLREDTLKIIKWYVFYKNSQYGNITKTKFAEAIKVLTMNHAHANVDAINL